MPRPTIGLGALVLAAIVSSTAGCRREEAPASGRSHAEHVVTVHYLEIVTPDVDAACSLYERLHGLSFGPQDASLGQARVAKTPEGTLVGIREPLAAHERPMMRTYFAVDDIHEAVSAAAERGATIAYPPTTQGDHGSFAILIQDGVEHGLWQP